MAIRDNPYDLGIVLYLIGFPGNSTYIDYRGQIVPVEELTTNYTTMVGSLAAQTAIMYPGASTAFSAWVLVNLAAATSISVKVQSQYGNDSAIDANWTDLQMVNQLTGTVSNEFTFTSSGTYLIQTASVQTVGKLRVVAKAAGVGFAANDYVKVSARVGL